MTKSVEIDFVNDRHSREHFVEKRVVLINPQEENNRAVMRCDVNHSPNKAPLSACLIPFCCSFYGIIFIKIFNCNGKFTEWVESIIIVALKAIY